MKVTTKGQVTIPARIREFLGIHPHTDVNFRIKGSTVILVKQSDQSCEKAKFEAMRGVLKDSMSTQEWMKNTRGN